MRDLLLKVLESYVHSKSEKIKEHEIAQCLRIEAKKIIVNKAFIDTKKYMLEGSAGKGNWADIPWIAIYDKDITNKATKGYYIVYLFCADMSGVYISLNQGWTYFKDNYKPQKKARESIYQVTNAWQNILSSPLKDFSFEKIDLKNNNKTSDLTKGYELGHICGKFYRADEVPNNKVLVQDLQNLLGVYRELKGNLKQMSIEKTNNYLLVNSNLGLFYKEGLDSDLNRVETNIANYKSSELELVKAPSNFIVKNDTPKNFLPKKVNFQKKNRTQKVLGLAGELIVLNYEIELLIKAGKHQLAKKVEHTSEEKGDGAGYDILSFELDGTKKYIEVKTTKLNSLTPFYITDNELEFSKKEASNYYLYRAYDYNIQENQAEFYILHGDLSNILSLKAQNYIVEGLLFSQ